MENGTWLMMDFEAGECELSQVGSPKQPISDAVEVVSASEQLKRDAMLAYKALGGPDYLKRNPELLDKTLLKMVAEPVQKTDATIKIVIDAPWMSPDRLAYLRRPQQDVIDMAPAIATPPPNTTAEIEAARRVHLEAVAKARVHDSGNPKGWRPEEDRQPQPLPLVRADDLLPPTLGDPRKRG